MRFGALIPQGWRLDLVGIPVDRHWSTMSGIAKSLEESGFDSLWVNDHFHTVPKPTQEVTYEAWSLMAAFAATTQRIRLGQMCTAVGYRNPAYLAKAAASVDVISGGRVEMGLGAGWYQHEYDGYGYPFPTDGERIDQLREAVEIMRRLWSEPAVDFSGDHFNLMGAICSPKPVQRPLPLWVAGGGEKKTLRVAARYADYTNFGQNLETFLHKDERLRYHCETLGRDQAEITRSSNLFVFCAPTETEARRKRDVVLNRIRSASGIGDENPTVKYWLSIAVTPNELSDILGKWSEAGLGYALLIFLDLAYDPTSMELVASDVMPRLK